MQRVRGSSQAKLCWWPGAQMQMQCSDRGREREREGDKERLGWGLLSSVLFWLILWPTAEAELEAGLSTGSRVELELGFMQFEPFDWLSTGQGSTQKRVRLTCVCFCCFDFADWRLSATVGPSLGHDSFSACFSTTFWHCLLNWQSHSQHINLQLKLTLAWPHFVFVPLCLYFFSTCP